MLLIEARAVDLIIRNYVIKEYETVVLFCLKEKERRDVPAGNAAPEAA